jgi:hypothetical protein
MTKIKQTQKRNNKNLRQKVKSLRKKPKLNKYSLSKKKLKGGKKKTRSNKIRGGGTIEECEREKTILQEENTNLQEENTILKDLLKKKYGYQDNYTFYSPYYRYDTKRENALKKMNLAIHNAKEERVRAAAEKSMPKDENNEEEELLKKVRENRIEMLEDEEWDPSGNDGTFGDEREIRRLEQKQQKQMSDVLAKQREEQAKKREE